MKRKLGAASLEPRLSGKPATVLISSSKLSSEDCCSVTIIASLCGPDIAEHQLGGAPLRKSDARLLTSRGLLVPLHAHKAQGDMDAADVADGAVIP